MGARRCRLDEAVVAQGLAADRDEASRLIMAGKVLVGDLRVDKPGTRVKGDVVLRLKQKGGRFVSRAGGKLVGALSEFVIDPSGLTCLDLGASTGGFTDCLLQHGAARVYAVDVGTNQLVWRLRTDPRVVCLEQTHARDLSRDLIDQPIQLLVADVSFTSLRYVLPAPMTLLAPKGEMVCLFKPQFEVPRHQVLPGGLVAADVAEVALAQMLGWCDTQGLEVCGQIKSPVKGLQGNQEYLLHLRPIMGRDD